MMEEFANTIVSNVANEIGIEIYIAYYPALHFKVESQIEYRNF